VFGNGHPVEIEIGPERGLFLLAAAAAHPQRNYLGIERSATRSRRLEAAVAASGLTNVRALNADATCVVARLVPPASVAAYHIYFPDPWWKRRHHRRRLLTSAFAEALARTLIPGGSIFLVTDVEETFVDAVASLDAVDSLLLDETGAPGRVHTAFAAKAQRHGHAIRAVCFRKRP
jgi:tRNA (guanine-N7-)-methyltransferase